MKKKSKFLTFMLSFVPGLGHIYLGFAARGALFFSAAAGVGIFMGIFDGLIWNQGVNPDVIAFAIPIIWLVSIVDSMMIADRINNYVLTPQNSEGIEKVLPNYGELTKQNKKLISMFLSIIPGAGHLYLGLQRQGIELMAGFFLAFYITDWLRISIFMIFVPIIWFYSMFDVMHKVSGDRPMQDQEMPISKWFKGEESIIGENSIFRNKHKVIGYTLVIFGALLIFNRLLYPLIESFIDYRIRGNIQTGIVAILLMAGGVKLILGSKQSEGNKKEEIS